MAKVVPYQGKWNTVWVPKAASTTITAWTFATPDGSGAYIPATASSATVAGIFKKTEASSDATNSLTPMAVPAEEGATFKASIGTGTGATSIVGLYRDLKDADELDVNASTTDIWFYQAFVSTTVAIGRINKLSGRAV